LIGAIVVASARPVRYQSVSTRSGGLVFKRIIACVLLLLGALRAAAADDKPELWLYYPTNLSVDQNLDKLADLWKRAAAAGYDHVLLADSKFAKLGDMPRHYFLNITRVKKIAADLHLQIVPAVFDVGYSNNLLWHDPNLAEGLPVVDQPFVVKGGEARPSSDARLPPKPGYKDPIVQLDGDAATVRDNPENARFNYTLKLPRFRCYHVSVQIKTDDYSGTPEVKAIGNTTKRQLQWQNLGVKHTQDWKEHHVVFNTLDNDEITLYFGVWGRAKGTLQWKGWKLEEAGLVNVLRRPGTPVSVKTESGQTLAEGKDYDRVEDPNLGNHPWKGEYDAWHEPVTIKTKLSDGTKLLVSWYHPAIIYDGQVSACIADTEMQGLLADQAKRMSDAWGEVGVAGYMMSHDEFRTLGWDAACQQMHKTPGELLADNAKYCVGLVHGSKVYVWNDMFDPFHNAVNGPYYLVNGPWTDSWEGLEQSVTIVNWNYGHRDDSLKFFADRGHPQLIAGFYDGSLDRDRNWLASSKKVKGIVGFMYTTWRGDYSKIEEYAKVVRGPQ
jgi:hypothetical protein